jgi:TonB family protein
MHWIRRAMPELHEGSKMKRWAMICACLLVLPMTARAQQVVRQRSVLLQLDVDAQGQVTATKVMRQGAAGGSASRVAGTDADGLPASLDQAVRAVARKWRFRAPRLHGQAVPGRTYAYTNMKILKMADGSYRLDLHYLRNGPVLRQLQAAVYPMRMRRLGYNGAVVVEAQVLPDGTITHALAVQAFTAASDRGRSFARAAVDMFKHARGVPMQLDGHAVTTRIRMPIYFQLLGKGNPEKEYGRQVDALMHPEKGAGRLQAPAAPNEAVAMDSPFVRQPSG